MEDQQTSPLYVEVKNEVVIKFSESGWEIDISTNQCSLDDTIKKALKIISDFQGGKKETKVPVGMG